MLDADPVGICVGFVLICGFLDDECDIYVKGKFMGNFIIRNIFLNSSNDKILKTGSIGEIPKTIVFLLIAFYI